MSTKYLTLVLLGAALAAPACEQPIEKEREAVERAAKEVDERKTEAAKEIGKAEEKLGEKEAKAERTSFANMANTRLERIDVNLSMARDDLKRVPDENRGDLAARLDAIESNRKHVSTELGRTHDLTAAEWPSFQANVLQSIQTLESDVEALHQSIKGQQAT